MRLPRPEGLTPVYLSCRPDGVAEIIDHWPKKLYIDGLAQTHFTITVPYETGRKLLDAEERKRLTFQSWLDTMFING